MAPNISGFVPQTQHRPVRNWLQHNLNVLQCGRFLEYFCEETGQLLCSVCYRARGSPRGFQLEAPHYMMLSSPYHCDGCGATPGVCRPAFTCDICTTMAMHRRTLHDLHTLRIENMPDFWFTMDDWFTPE